MDRREPGDLPELTDAAEAARRLADGGLVAIPTETVYGLAADATDPVAVARVYDVKGRPTDHPLIVHVADIET
ncbi:MAG: L-threonylcarbamoyladenylate synthase, partial [Ilumatobacteraceae bacterium]